MSIHSRHTLDLDVERTQLVTLDVERYPLENYWYFVYPSGKQLSLVARTFMDFVRAEAKQLVYDHLAQIKS